MRKESASRKLQEKDAFEMLKTVDDIYVSKGNKVNHFDLLNDRPDEETLRAHLLGPTGNLRAPALRQGRTLIIGFNQEQYLQVFGRE